MISRYRSLLIKLFSEVQRIHSDPFRFASEYLKLQEILITRITYVERQIRQRKTDIKALKRLLGSKTSGLNKSSSQIAKSRVTHYHAQIDEYQELLTILRWVGDALAFSFIDRWDIKPLGLKKESAGFLSGKKGARRERRILRALFSYGFIAILNDLTNCLRYGDITVLDRNGRYHIAEVKSKKKLSERVERQMTEAEHILEYLSSDHTDRLYGLQANVQRVSAHAQPDYHTSQINEVIADALARGNSYREVESGLYYFATTGFDPEVVRQISQQCKGKMIAALVEPQAYSELVYYPLTLSLNNPEALYLLCAGKLTIVVMVDSGVIKEKLEVNAISLEAIGEGEDYALSVRCLHPVDNQPVEMKVGNHLFQRVFAEFLSLDWIVQYIVSFMKIDAIAKMAAG